jgi:hypothetical protein
MVAIQYLKARVLQFYFHIHLLQYIYYDYCESQKSRKKRN